MGTRTVRLDDAAERVLARLRRRTGLSISEVLKRGLESLDRDAERSTRPRAIDVYRTLDLGEGGWAVASSQNAKAAVRDLIAKKHGRRS